MTKMTPEDLKRCENVLGVAFRGIYHLETEKITRRDFMVEARTSQDLATFDFDTLTRLVVAAHEEAVRVSILPCGNKSLRIYLHPRKRHGNITERHPTTQEAVDSVYKNYAEYKVD